MDLIISNLKALVVVLGVGLAVFIIARPLCLRFMSEASFLQRRNVWIALTVVAFVSPSFWLFVLVACLVLVWSARHETNPVALYILIMHVIPPGIAFEIPSIGIRLLELDIYRLLALVLLLPAAWRVLQDAPTGRKYGFQALDSLLIAFGVVQLVLLMPYESITHTMRRAVVFAVDIFLIYFVVSRTNTNRQAIVEVLATFALVCTIYAPLAVFESLRVWLLYAGIAENWGASVTYYYLLREDVLRAHVSANHPIPLGYLLAVGFGFWLYLSSRVKSHVLTTVVSIWMWAGLIAAYSRAPWLAAAFAYFAYFALGPNAQIRLTKAVLLTVPLGALVLMSPAGERLLDNLPFIGTVEPGTVSYRQYLAEASWHLIKLNPLFGNPFVLIYLEDLRTGQGIIDLMNTYATVAMFYGLVGFLPFTAFFVLGLWKAISLSKQVAKSDPDLALLGAAIAACILATLLTMATGSFGGALRNMAYVLVGLAAGYAQIKVSTTSQQVLKPTPLRPPASSAAQ